MPCIEWRAREGTPATDAKAGVDAGLCAYQVRSTRFSIFTSGLTSAS